MKKGLLILAAVALLTFAPVKASAAIRGFVAVRPFYGWYGPYWGPYWGAYGGPYWGPGYYGGFYYATGHIKVDTKVNNAEVFINGAFAGTTHDAKNLHLRPGRYKIEIKEAGKTRFSQQVYVIPGKTLHLHPEL